MDKKPPKRDVNTVAFNIVRQATGEEPKRQPRPEKADAQAKPTKPKASPQ
jgi:hypothetical protein